MREKTFPHLNSRLMAASEEGAARGSRGISPGEFSLKKTLLEYPLEFLLKIFHILTRFHNGYYPLQMIVDLLPSEVL